MVLMSRKTAPVRPTCPLFIFVLICLFFKESSGLLRGTVPAESELSVRQQLVAFKIVHELFVNTFLRSLIMPEGY